MERPGCGAAAQHHGHWIIRSSRWFVPLWNLLRKEMLQQSIVNADETRCHVLKEDGRESKQMSQMWVYCSPEKKIALYQYHPSRKGQVAKEMLGDFSGYLQTRRYSGMIESNDRPLNEELEQDAAAERLAELESALEQDEHPLDYEAELETEEEEALPVSEKRLKREIRAEAVRRLEEAARTEADFSVVIGEWDKLDRNRERRERDYENLRGDLPLDYQTVSEPELIPRWMNHPTYRQIMAGNFLDILFDCPYEMHKLTADPFISRMIQNLSDDHKEVCTFYLCGCGVLSGLPPPVDSRTAISEN